VRVNLALAAVAMVSIVIPSNKFHRPGIATSLAAEMYWAASPDFDKGCRACPGEPGVLRAVACAALAAVAL